MERFPAIIFEGKSFRQHLHDLSLLSSEIPHNESSRWWFSTQKCVHNRSNTVDFCGGVVELLVFEIFQRDGLIPVRIGCRKKAARFAVADTAPHSRNCSKRINLFPYEVLECTAYNLTRTIRSLKYDAHTFGCLHTILIFSEADTADIKSSRELL